MSTSTSQALDFNCRSLDEDVDDLDFELLDLDDEELRQMEYQQTGKRKNRLNDEDTAAPRPRAVRQRPGLEESTTPDNNLSTPRRRRRKEGFLMNQFRLCFGMRVRIIEVTGTIRTGSVVLTR
uniref:Uncharacterized protein n=1 Tax=Peronospora matthiolae TaxID=2874970 RepID=A0AAV1TEQ9_9STRA